MTDPSQNPSPSPVVQDGTQPRAGHAWVKWSLLAAAVLAVGYGVFVRPLHKPAPSGRAGAGSAAVPVTAEAARKADLDVRIVSLGTVTPLSTVTVHSRVDGELQKIYFQEGAKVEAEDPLADLDPRPFEVQKMQAEAQLAKDKALLDDARLNLTRYQKLLGEDSVAKQQVDTQASLVRQYKAALQVDEAQVASAALQLTYAHITAPIAGRIGLRTVDQGNIVHAADATGIAVITRLSPITVLFSIPQDAIPQVLKNSASGPAMDVDAFDRDGRTRLATGRLVTVDNQIDPATGTVRLRAEFANADETLFPNQFVNIQLVAEHLQGATVIPAAALQRGTAGTYVYVVADNKTVSVRPVETGPSEHGVTAITKGLSPGETVVVDGIDKLREGSAVELISRDAAAASGKSGASRRDKSSAHPPAAADPASAEARHHASP